MNRATECRIENDGEAAKPNEAPLHLLFPPSPAPCGGQHFLNSGGCRGRLRRFEATNAERPGEKGRWRAEASTRTLLNNSPVNNVTIPVPNEIRIHNTMAYFNACMAMCIRFLCSRLLFVFFHVRAFARFDVNHNEKVRITHQTVDMPLPFLSPRNNYFFL